MKIKVRNSEVGVSALRVIGSMRWKSADSKSPVLGKQKHMIHPFWPDEFVDRADGQFVELSARRTPTRAAQPVAMVAILSLRASARISKVHRQQFSSLAHHLGPLNVIDDDPALFELLAPPQTSAAASSHRSIPATEYPIFRESDMLAYQRQLALEDQTVETAVARFQRMAADAAARGDVWSHMPASRLVGGWVDPMTLAIRKAQEEDIEQRAERKGGRSSVERDSQRLLKLLPPHVLTVITIHEVFGALMREPHGHKLTSLAITLGNAVRAEVNQAKLRKLELQQAAMERNNANRTGNDGILDSSGGVPKAAARTKQKGRKKSALERALKSPTSIVSAVNYVAMKAEVSNAVWSTKDTVLLGTALINILLGTAFVVDPVTNKTVPAFRHFRRYLKKNNVVGMVQLENAALKLIAASGDDISSFIVPKHQPMEVRPRPWVSPWNGGYLKTDVKLVRAPPSSALDDALAAADLQTLFDGLNALGDTTWQVNRGVLETGLKLWDSGGDTAGLVSKTDVEVPTKSKFLKEEQALFSMQKAQEDVEEEMSDEFDETLALRKLKRARRAAKKTNREMFSQRADTQYRLDHAKAFAQKERFYLPHNVDFRGRAYPIPVYLQHMGADLTRAMLTFSTPGVRLGERGVYWLKVHLANLLGADKKSYEERVAVAENALPRAIEVGRDPLSDSNIEWWCKHEDPFQLLAACMEFANAVGRHGGEAAMEEFHSTLPVSMDGSCNGLQHYAALGRDVLGGKQVNLIRSDRPQDVYSGVCEFVIKRVEAEAKKGDEIAKLLVGKVNRKIVKQTVMTSVYGVTLTGAREQIQNRLKDIEFPNDKIFDASLMLAKMTLASLGDIFSGATGTMDWLSSAAYSIASNGRDVQWVTPVGLPVLQPYRKKARSVVKTIMQRVTLEQQGDHLPVSPQRQRSAFPPNFVHSIDSSHMLYTAIACKNAGMNFAAVHDSFWTNAATVDEMHEILREEFVRLHSRELLAEVREGFMMRYPDVKFAELPARGSLGLKEVLDSPYFFS